MYEELIQRLRTAGKFSTALSVFFPEDGNTIANLFVEAADALEKLVNFNDTYCSRCDKNKTWIPVKSRPMDEEERKEWSEKIGYDIEYEDAVIYTSQLPDDGQEVLTCNRYGTIAIDKFYNDPDLGCCFEENGDMDGIIAWMPLPEPPKKEVKE